jgi:proliferating cell nuclear antigen
MSMFKAVTAHAVALRASFDALSNAHIAETCLQVGPTGIQVAEIDPAQCMVLNLFLEKAGWQNYELHEKELVVGVSVPSIQRLLKGVGAKDTVCLEILYDSPEILQLTVFNDFNKTQLVHKLKVLLIGHDEITIDHREVDRTVSMPSAEFAKYMKEFASMGKKVEIEVDQDQLVFRCNTDMCVSEAVIKPKTNDKGRAVGNGCISIGLGRNGNARVRQTFAVKYLQSIAKSSGLDEQVTLYATQGRPLLVRYNIAVVGFIVYLLAPEPCPEDDDPGAAAGETETNHPVNDSLVK